ncbi:MAG: flagellar M-ring protein FliF, partial [Leptospiraceae bacterium]|nr:flagellar M-ring protein FliF [Leptospiraceae bacterium]
MPESLQRILDQIVGFWNGLDIIKKGTIGAVLVVVIIAFAAMGNYSKSPEKVLLYGDLSPQEYASITESLDAMGYGWSASGTDQIYVDGLKRQEIITKLAQDNLIPVGVEGWEIFN